MWFSVALGQTALQASYSVNGENGQAWLYSKLAVSAVGGYKLVTTLQTTTPPEIEGDEIIDFRLVFTGSWPDVLANPNQDSFVVLNVPDAATLAGLDTDADGLNDYEELYEAFTNPYDADTDSDGATDDDEVAASTDPNDFNGH